MRDREVVDIGGRLRTCTPRARRTALRWPRKATRPARRWRLAGQAAAHTRRDGVPAGNSVRLKAGRIPFSLLVPVSMGPPDFLPQAPLALREGSLARCVRPSCTVVQNSPASRGYARDQVHAEMVRQTRSSSECSHGPGHRRNRHRLRCPRHPDTGIPSEQQHFGQIQRRSEAILAPALKDLSLAQTTRLSTSVL